MAVSNTTAEITAPVGLGSRLGHFFAPIPMVGWLLGALVAVVLEQLIGRTLAVSLGLNKVPVLFGALVILKTPALIPSTLLYVLLIYVLPIVGLGRLCAPLTNALARLLASWPLWLSTLLHLVLFYAVLHLWGEMSDYRLITARLTMVAVITTLSLNLINGYMGEFSCSHPGFMAVGAYATSVVTVLFFAKDKLYGAPLLPPEIGFLFFPVALIIGGMAAALSSLVVAIPSFRTRGDYLAIISLAFLFIVKSLIENLEIIGGPRGLSSQPNYATLPVVFCVTVLSVWIINNFVNSTFGKACNAVRDFESAADAMSVNTRRTKMVTFMFSAFWAGVAGGLFAHVLRYVNPATFGLQKLAEVLAMVYFGGLNSVVGSIVGAVSISVLGEALRPLEIFKWIVIPLLLILVMIYRPTGLIAFREFNVRKILQPKTQPGKEG